MLTLEAVEQMCSSGDAATNPSKCCSLTGSKECCECFFGQYYAFEDTSDVVEISGMTVYDVDLEELSPEAQLDVTVLARRGTVNFNSRTGLTFYDQSARNRLGYTAKSDATNNAISVLKYRVELPELANRKESTILNYNTQQLGEEEYFDLTFNDQVSVFVLLYQ